MDTNSKVGNTYTFFKYNNLNILIYVTADYRNNQGIISRTDLWN